MSYYVNSTNKFRKFLQTIKKVQRPGTADNKWLKKLGYTGGNDYQFLRVLEQINFVDSSRVPNDNWKDYQDIKKSKEDIE